jgi:hypothetical protein
LLAEVFARLGRKEINEARRATKNPSKFLSWMDTFYPAFEATLAEALAPAVAVCGRGDAAELAAFYCQDSREQLLRVAEAKPAEFPAHVEALLNAWNRDRPALEASTILRSIHADVQSQA